MDETTYVAFAGSQRIAQGELRAVLGALKKRFDRDAAETVLVFDEESGRQIDFDLRGSLGDVVDRAFPARGPGRPRLGVVSREVSLLPRHWTWLERQPNGISAALRRLIDAAARADHDKAKRLRNALSYVLTAIAGNLRNYEDATRALFAGDTERLDTLIASWPKDIRDYASRQARAAAAAEDGHG